MVASKHILLDDNVKLRVGSSADLEIYHDGSNSNYITSTTSDIYLRNEGNNDRIFIQATYSGTISNYLIIDGSTELVKFEHNSKHKDSVKALFGDSSDLEIFHDGNSVIRNQTGDLFIDNYADDKDIIFRSDDGAGSQTEYFRVDGSSGKIIYSKNQWLYDNIRAVFGSSDDLQIFHNGTSSYIENTEGNIVLVNYANDKDIQLYSDDGSGGTTEYFRLDGSYANSGAVYTVFPDSSNIALGSNRDLRLYHNGTNSNIENFTGTLQIIQNLNDGDINFLCDDGAGGATEYFRLDGGSTLNVFSKATWYGDGVKAMFGNSTDLQIYHDGSNSYIDETGAGSLYVRAAANMYFQTYGSGKRFASFFENDTVVLYNNDVEKLRTIGSGIRISGVSEYADNTAAIAGGLTTGDVYRTGDLLKIVH